jgi:tetratricopeptide (TPR) repeat protein
MKKAWLFLLAAAALGAGAWLLLGRTDTSELLLASIPARPQGVTLPPALVERIDNSEQDVRGHKSVAALADLARLYHSNGYFAEAELCYNGLLELEPRKPRWPHLLASILAGYGQLEESIPLYRQAVKLAPDYLPARVRLGDVLLKANHDKEAYEAYEGVLRINGEHPYALLGLARVEIQRGEWDSARIHLEAAAAKSNYAIGGDLLVNAYEKTGRATLARSLAAQQKASGAFYDIPDPWVDELFIDCYDPYRATIASGSAMRNGDMDTAIRLLEHVNKVAPRYALAYYHLGLIYTELKKIPNAIMAMEKSAELDPAFSDTWLRLVRLNAQSGDELAARMALEKGIKLCPHSPRLHAERAGRHAAAGRVREAEADYRSIITLRPDESFGYVEFAKFLFTQNRIEEAIAVLNKGIEIEPEEPMILSIMAFHAISIGDEARARQLLQRMKAQPRTTADSIDALVINFRKAFNKFP